MPRYLPEGILIQSAENRQHIEKPGGLEQAMEDGLILEARAMLCDSNHNLIVDLAGRRGIIPRTEGALGIAEGSTRDIAVISRVGKPVCFKVTGFGPGKDGRHYVQLSRRAAQQDCQDHYLSALRPGDIIPARVTHLEPFGSFVDIGCGVVSLIPIDTISVSRIAHPSDRFCPGQDIFAVVRGRDPLGRITLSHKELLGSWVENAEQFSPGETVAGIVRSVESYGIFVELSPNLAGLAEPKPGVRPGQQASVYIKSLIPEKMKVKLIIVDAFDAPCPPRSPLPYRITEGRLRCWRYSPPQSDRVVETVFEK
jgi:small subunit ribosomal protein S1